MPTFKVLSQVPATSTAGAAQENLGLQGGIIWLGNLAASAGVAPDFTLINGALSGIARDVDTTALGGPFVDKMFQTNGVSDAVRMASGTTLDVTDQTFLASLVFRRRAPGIGAGTLASKRLDSGTFPGWRMTLSASGFGSVVIDDGANDEFVTLTNDLGDGTWQKLSLLVNRVTDRIYADDHRTTIKDLETLGMDIGSVGSITTTAPLSLGAGQGVTFADLDVLFYGQWPNTNGQLDSWSARRLHAHSQFLEGAIPSLLVSEPVYAGIDS